MKKKRLAKYTISLLVCFFAFLGFVHADKSISLGSYVTVDSTDFINMKCDSNDGLLKVEYSALGPVIKYENKVEDTSIRPTVTCSWDGRIRVGGNEGPSSQTFTFELINTQNAYRDENGELKVSEVRQRMKVVNGESDGLNLAETSGILNITGYNITDGKEYVKFKNGVCSGSECTVEPSEETKKIAGGATITVNIELTGTLNGEEVKTKVIITIEPQNYAMLFPGEYGDCKLGGWTKQGPYQNSYYYTTDNPNAVLPSCGDDNTDAPVKFKGWSKTTSGESKRTSSNQCLSGAVYEANTPAVLGETYMACYEELDSVIVTAPRGRIVASGDWKSINNSIYAYSYSGEGTVALPDVTDVEGFKGWVKIGTNDEPIAAGTSVPVDGSRYSALIETEIVYRDMTKVVREGRTAALVIPAGIKSCTSNDNTIVSTSMNGGECQVQSQSDSAGKSTQVIVLLENGQTVTYTYKVIAAVSADNAEFFIDTSVNLEWGENYNGGTPGSSGSEDLTELACSSVKIRFADKSTTDSSMYFGDTKSGKSHSRIRSTTYEVQSNCSTDSNKYWAYCLDPSLDGPDSSAFEIYDIKDNDLTESHKTLFNVIAYISKISDDMSFVDQANDTTKNAVHHATRIAAIMDGLDSGKEGDPYYSRYVYYKKTADEIKKCAAGDQTCIRNAIVANFSDKSDSEITGNGKTVVDNMALYLAQGTSDTKAAGGKAEKTVDKKTVSSEGGITTNEVEGTFILPASTSKVELLPCDGINGITCSVEKMESGGQTEDGRQIYKYIVKMTRANTGGKLPETEDEKKKLSFKLNYDGVGVERMHLAVSRSKANQLQRMLVFTVGKAAVYAYFPFDVDCEAYVTDIDSHLGNDKSDPFVEEFVNAGCCAYLHDEDKYGSFLDKNCGDRCTTNTMAQVCSYAATSGKVDIYRVKEGHNSEGYQIGSCIVNVSDKYKVSDNSKFERTDDVKNKLNVKEFDAGNNEYCEVTCREEWTIVMEAFGNYVGKNAVVAGTYFKTQTDDLFIGSKRECYTSYIDYQSFVKEMTELSQKVVDSYNLYSDYSHVYTDINKQTLSSAISNETFSFSPDTGCIKWPSCEDVHGEGYTYNETDDVCEATKTGCDPNSDDEKVKAKPCIDEKDAPKCPTENYGQVNSYALTTYKENNPNRVKSTGDTGETYDKSYVTTTKPDDKNNDGVITTKKQLSDGGNLMKDIYNSSAKLNCTMDDDDWATKPGEEANAPDCTMVEDGDYEGSGGSPKNFCNTTSSLDSNFCVNGDTFDKDGAFSALQDFVKDLYSTAADEERKLVSSYTNTIYEKDEMFYACQHIQLNNDSTLASNKKNNDDLSSSAYILGKNGSYTKLSSTFDPGATYRYDDSAYMTILGKDNLIEQYTKKNDQVLEDKKYEEVTNVKKEITIENANDSGGDSKVNLAKNYLETSYYHNEIPWTDDTIKNNYDDPAKKEFFVNGSVEGYKTHKGNIVLCTIGDSSLAKEAVTEDGGIDLSGELNPIQTTSVEWTDGACFVVNLQYNDINYVKTSIENSSFYKNKGSWFYSGSNSLFVAHGDNKEDALKKLKALSGNKMDSLPSGYENWYIPALINVFPVSYSTPRNIYTYTYDFGNMGYYVENGKLGRIMGGDKPVIQANSRTCFYEVVEEACVCCGSEPYTYTYDENVHGSGVIEGAAAYMGYDLSDKDAIANNKNGVLSITPSVVQLGDLNSDSPRKLASNWGESSFLYDGVLYNTNKGSELIREIEMKGETIYTKGTGDSDLEYEYELTPSDIANIKEYNDEYGYGISHDRLKIIDRYSNGDANKELDLDDAETISFLHYGSTFLEDFLPASVTKKALYQGSNTTVCYVEAGQVGGASAGNPVLHNLMINKNCRWIDYVTTAVESEELNNSYDKKGMVDKPDKIRMAFK